MPTSSPVAVRVPTDGVAFAESVHAANFFMPERSEVFHKLLLVQQGRVSFHWTHEGKSHSDVGTSGTLWIVPAGRRHHVADAKPSVLLLLCLGKRLAGEDRHFHDLWKYLEARASQSLAVGPILSRLESGWRRALREDHQQYLGSAASQQAIALQTLVALARWQAHPADTGAERIRQFRERVEQTLYEPWTIDRAAESVSLSRRQFTKLFRRETGRSFLEFLLERRLEYAERLLKSGRHTITGAAFSAGFGDLSHFYRLFKRRHRLPPNAWLKRRRPAA